MGENEIIDVANLLAPQERRDNVFSGVETVLVGAAAIDQHPFPFWKFDQDRIAMPHVEKGEGEIPLEMIFQVPVSEVKDENHTESDPEIPNPSAFPEMDNREEKKIIENDLKRGRG